MGLKVALWVVFDKKNVKIRFSASIPNIDVKFGTQ